jgi:hypothetical protein
MYGIIMTAVVTGVIGSNYKRKNIKISMTLSLSQIKRMTARYLVGGTLLDWVGH